MHSKIGVDLAHQPNVTDFVTLLINEGFLTLKKKQKKNKKICEYIVDWWKVCRTDFAISKIASSLTTGHSTVNRYFIRTK